MNENEVKYTNLIIFSSKSEYSKCTNEPLCYFQNKENYEITLKLDHFLANVIISQIIAIIDIYGALICTKMFVDKLYLTNTLV